MDTFILQGIIIHLRGPWDHPKTLLPLFSPNNHNHHIPHHFFLLNKRTHSVPSFPIFFLPPNQPHECIYYYEKNEWERRKVIHSRFCFNFVCKYFLEWPLTLLRNLWRERMNGHEIIMKFGTINLFSFLPTTELSVNYLSSLHKHFVFVPTSPWKQLL